jgi:hypothetical protein
VKQFLLVIFFLLSGVAQCQEISPVIQSCSKRCQGDFSVRNKDIKPLWVNLEPKAITYVNGALVLAPLDATGVKLTLNRKSVRIPPMGDYRFSYKLTCSAYPCAVEVFASMVIGKTPDGVEVKLSLPEAIYACSDGKADDCRKTFRKLNNVAD